MQRSTAGFDGRDDRTDVRLDPVITARRGP
jgi:hypothetical protein